MAEEAWVRAPQTMLDLLRQRAERYGDKVAFAYSTDGEAETNRVTYQQLETRARAIASTLQRQGAAGERVLVLCPSGLDFIAGMFGCFYAGTVAIPVHPPVQSRLISRVASIVADSQARFVLTTADLQSELKPVVDDLTEGGSLSGVPRMQTHLRAAAEWVTPEIDPSATAFVQYTSGSTGTPKGVDLTHATCSHNLDGIHKRLGASGRTKLVSWLPLHHDMGLIGAVFGVLYAGGTCFLMPPGAFIRAPCAGWRAHFPVRRQRSVSRPTSPTNSVSNAAARRSASRSICPSDGAMCGAEPVRVATMKRFADAFGPAGFRPEVLPSGVRAGRVDAVRVRNDGSQRRAEGATRGQRRAGVSTTSSRSPPNTRRRAARWLRPGAHESQEIVIVDPATGRQCQPTRSGRSGSAGRT